MKSKWSLIEFFVNVNVFNALLYYHALLVTYISEVGKVWPLGGRFGMKKFSAGGDIPPIPAATKDRGGCLPGGLSGEQKKKKVAKKKFFRHVF